MLCHCIVPLSVNGAYFRDWLWKDYQRRPQVVDTQTYDGKWDGKQIPNSYTQDRDWHRWPFQWIYHCCLFIPGLFHQILWCTISLICGELSPVAFFLWTRPAGAKQKQWSESCYFLEIVTPSWMEKNQGVVREGENVSSFRFIVWNVSKCGPETCGSSVSWHSRSAPACGLTSGPNTDIHTFSTQSENDWLHQCNAVSFCFHHTKKENGEQMTCFFL